MSSMYFAKISLNSNIYDLYNNPNLFSKYLKELFLSVNEKVSLNDEYGNEYRFNTLVFPQNSEMIVAGRLSKIYNGSVETYDRKKNKPKSEDTQDLSSTANFYFDAKNEIVAFVHPRNLGYMEFCRAFKALLEVRLKDVELDVQIIPNIGELKSKMDNIAVIKEVTVVLIPPNPPNRKEFDELFGKKGEYILDSGATRYKETIECSSKKKEGLKKGDFIFNAIEAIKKGYGKFIAKGKNSSGVDITLSSDENTPLKYPIKTKDKDNIYYILEIGKHNVKSVLYEMNKKEE